MASDIGKFEWFDIKIPDREIKSRRDRKKMLQAHPPKFVQFDTSKAESNCQLDQMPPLVIQVMKRSFTESRRAAGAAIEGGVHPNQVEYIECVIIVEPSASQYYVAVDLHENPHYQIAKCDVDLFLSYCKNGGVKVEYVSRTVPYWEYVSSGGDVKLRVCNIGCCDVSGEETAARDKPPVDWESLEKEFYATDFNAIMSFAVGNDGSTLCERGNYQKSIGVLMLDQKRDEKTQVSRFNISKDATGRFNCLFPRDAKMLEAVQYEFPDGDLEYQKIRQEGSQAIHREARTDNVTLLAAFFPYSDSFRKFLDDAQHEGGTAIFLPGSKAFDMDSSNILKAHCDKYNAKEPGRNMSAGVMACGKAYHFGLKDGVWQYLLSSACRCGTTSYCKRFVACCVNNASWLGPLIDGYAGCYESMSEQERDLFKAHRALGDKEEGPVLIHADPRTDQCKLLLAYKLIDSKFHDQMTERRIIELGLAPSVANNLDWLVQFARDMKTFPDEHLVEAYCEYARRKWGSASGGRYSRRQVAFNKPLDRSRLFIATRKVSMCLKETNIRTRTVVGTNELRLEYVKFVKEIQANVPNSGEMNSQIIARFYVMMTLVENARLLLFAFIPNSTRSGKRVIDKLEEIFGDRSMAEQIFFLYRPMIVKTLGYKMADIDGALHTMLNSDRVDYRKSIIDEAKAEHLICGSQLAEGKLEMRSKDLCLMGLVFKDGELTRVVFTAETADKPEVFKPNIPSGEICVAEPAMEAEHRRLLHVHGKCDIHNNEHDWGDCSENRGKIEERHRKNSNELRWDKASLWDLENIQGVVESHITAEELSSVMLENGSSRSKGSLWRRISKKNNRKEQLLKILSDEVKAVVKSIERQTYKEWKQRKQPSGRKSVEEGNGTDASDEEDGDEEEAVCNEKDRRVVSRRGKRMKPAPPRYSSDEASALIDLWMGGETSSTSLSKENQDKNVLLKNEFSSPWSPQAAAEKKEKKQPSLQEICKARRETLRGNLKKVQMKCEEAVVGSAFIPRLELLLFGDVLTEPKRKSGSRKCLGLAAGKEEGEEQTEGEKDTRPGNRAVEPEGLRVKFLTGLQLTVHIGRKSNSRKGKNGYFCVGKDNGVLFDYSCSSALDGFLPDQLEERDEHRRILYSSHKMAKLAFVLSRMLDSPLSGFQDSLLSTVERLEGKVPLITNLFDVYKQPIMWEGSGEQMADYLILRHAGEQGPNQEKLDKVMLIILRKRNKNGDILLGGFMNGAGDFDAGCSVEAPEENAEIQKLIAQTKLFGSELLNNDLTARVPEKVKEVYRVYKLQTERTRKMEEQIRNTNGNFFVKSLSCLDDDHVVSWLEGEDPPFPLPEVAKHQCKRKGSPHYKYAWTTEEDVQPYPVNGNVTNKIRIPSRTRSVYRGAKAINVERPSKPPFVLNPSTDQLSGSRKRNYSGTDGYCWTHGLTASHTSAKCRHPNPGHQRGATFSNTMGGAPLVCWKKLRRQKRLKAMNVESLSKPPQAPNPSTVQLSGSRKRNYSGTDGHCWTHGLTASHISAKCRHLNPGHQRGSIFRNTSAVEASSKRQPVALHRPLQHTSKTLLTATPAEFGVLRQLAPPVRAGMTASTPAVVQVQSPGGDVQQDPSQTSALMFTQTEVPKQATLLMEPSVIRRVRFALEVTEQVDVLPRERPPVRLAAEASATVSIFDETPVQARQALARLSTFVTRPRTCVTRNEGRLYDCSGSDGQATDVPNSSFTPQRSPKRANKAFSTFVTRSRLFVIRNEGRLCDCSRSDGQATDVSNSSSTPQRSSKRAKKAFSTFMMRPRRFVTRNEGRSCDCSRSDGQATGVPDSSSFPQHPSKRANRASVLAQVLFPALAPNRVPVLSKRTIARRRTARRELGLP